MKKAILLILAACLILPAQAGTIEGTVQIKSGLKSKPTADKRRFTLPPGADVYKSGPKKAAAQVDQTLNVVVYLPDAKGGPDRTGKHEIVQKNREFIPFVLPIQVGTTVEFPNEDTIYHSVYSESPSKPFVLKEYPRGESRNVTFDKTGIVKLFCAIHPYMNAYILVLSNGYYATPDADHHFKLTNVPAGKYRLEAWHPLLTPVSRVIEVPEDGTVTVNLTL